MRSLLCAWVLLIGLFLSTDVWPKNLEFTIRSVMADLISALTELARFDFVITHPSLQ